MTKVQKTDNVQANYNAQNNKKVKKQEAGKKAVFNKAKKSASKYDSNKSTEPKYCTFVTLS